MIASILQLWCQSSLGLARLCAAPQLQDRGEIARTRGYSGAARRRLASSHVGGSEPASTDQNRNAAPAIAGRYLRMAERCGSAATSARTAASSRQALSVKNSRRNG